LDEQTAELVAAVAAAVDADTGADIVAAVDVDIAAPAEFDGDVDVTQVVVVAVDVDDDVVVEMAGQGEEERAPAAAAGDADAEAEDVQGDFVAEVDERVLVVVAETEAEKQEAVADDPMALAEVVQTTVVAPKVDKNLCDPVGTYEMCVEGEEGSVLGGRKPTGTVNNPDGLLLALDVDGVGPAHGAAVQIEWHARVAQGVNSAAQDDTGPPTAVETQVHMSRTVADIH
jgi:hypothetical protein